MTGKVPKKALSMTALRISATVRRIFSDDPGISTVENADPSAAIPFRSPIPLVFGTYS